MRQRTKTPFLKTIIIKHELNAEMRGYTLAGREFLLHQDAPVRDESITLDGHIITDEFWVVSKEEYMRVVPEARGQDFNSDFVYIPTFIAMPSVRPCYIKSGE